MPPEEKDDIERLKRSLYSRAKKDHLVSDIRAPLSADRPDAPVSWPSSAEATDGQGATQKTEKKVAPIGALMMTPKKKMSFAAKFFLGSIAFFIIAAALSAYIFFGGGNIISPQNIDLQIVMPSLVDAGKGTSFQVLIDNRNTSALEIANLSITYPDGTRDPSDGTPLPHEEQSIGTIAAGAEVKQTANAVFYGGEGAQEEVQVSLEYSVAGSNAIYQKQASANFVIGSSPISLSIQAPQEAISGQAFPIDITVQSNATTPVSNVVVEGQYPFGYSVQSSSPQSLAGGTFWQLGTLAPGAAQIIHVMGSLTGQDGDQRVFKFLAGSNTDPTDTTVEVPLLAIPQTITVQKPFISGVIAIDGQTGSTISAPAGQPLQGTVTWQNNLPTAVSNVELSVGFSGPALDQSSVSSADGFYQSQNSSIIWTSAQDPTLAQVSPGAGGTLQFSFASLPPGANNVLVTNPSITVNFSVQGTQTGASGAPSQVSSAASAQVSIASALSLASQALHFTGSIPNSGPMPPKAGQDTSYTVVWAVKNSSNTIANATVSAVLPSYVRYVSAGASGVTYDSGSNTVTWNLGDLSPGVGYTAAAKQADFQVILTPSASQAGSIPQIVGQATLSGTDRFAQVGVSATAPPLTTTLNEAGFVGGMDVVSQ